MRKPPYLKSQIHQGVADLEKRVKVRRNKTFEREQLNNLVFEARKRKPKRSKAWDQTQPTRKDYKISVFTPKLGIRMFVKKGDMRIKVMDVRPKYQVRFGKNAFTFQTLDQMLLWLYRRAQTALLVDKRLAGYLEGLAERIEIVHEVYRYDR